MLMDEVEIRELLEAGLGECAIQLQSDGARLALSITASAFDGLSRVKRQQLVLRLLTEKINSGEVHAVTMKCMTPAESSA